MMSMISHQGGAGSVRQRGVVHACRTPINFNQRQSICPIPRKLTFSITFLLFFSLPIRACQIEPPVQLNANPIDRELESEISQPTQFQLPPIQ
jgi:hypothetical protein